MSLHSTTRRALSTGPTSEDSRAPYWEEGDQMTSGGEQARSRTNAQHGSGVKLRFSIAGYSLLAPLGQGGFAQVFRAKHEQTDRLVALKVLHYRSAFDDEARERHRARFWRETALCADLHHPNIVSLVDRGQTADGELFAAYDFIPGETLRQVLDRRGPLPPAEAAELMGQILDAIACAHASGVVHRDLKPENIMVSQTGAKQHAVVLDFGIGAFTEPECEQREQLTLSTESVGTPGYASPEQLRGERPTPRSDIYAWGLVFLECLTGQPAIQGQTAAEIVQRQLDTTEVPLPPTLIGHELGALLRRAVRKAAAQRAASASALLGELSGLNLARLVGTLESLPAPNAAQTPIARTEEALSPHWDALIRHERRQLTVVMLDVEIAAVADMDQEQEELEQLQQDLLNRAHDVIDRWGGWVAGSLTGRMLSYFGYPYALQDDVRRAARAALEFLEASKQSQMVDGQPNARLIFRAAVDTGRVIVTSTGPQDGMTQSATRRLLDAAEGGQLRVGKAAARLLTRWSELQIQPSKLDEGSPVSLVVQRGCAGASHLWGRKRELEYLGARLSKAISGQRSWILLQGDAGVGKSALLRELRRQPSENGLVLEARCLPEQRNTALFPLLESLRTAARTSPAGMERPLEVGLHEIVDEAGHNARTLVPILLNWMGLPPPQDYPQPLESPDRQRALLREFLVDRFVGRPSDGPRLLLLEDIHWADALTVQLLGEAIESNSNSGSLVVMTSRMEFDPQWAVGRYELLPLGGLDAAGAAALAAGLLGAPLSETALATVMERTAGVPLFIEELLTSLRDQQILLNTLGVFELDARADAAAVPATLRDLLTEKLDHLGAARETIALAATLGPEIPVLILQALSDRSPDQVAADISAAREKNLIVATPSDDGEAFSFRHALIQECAYELVLPSLRARVHSRIADLLSEGFPNSGLSKPALLARHFALGKRMPEAVAQGTRAARAAISRAANQEASAHATSVLDWAAELPAAERVDAQLAANGVLVQALMAMRGWADSLVKERVDFSRQLVDQSANRDLLTESRVALMTYHYVASNRSELARLSSDFHVAALARADDELLAPANTFMGLVAHGAGQYNDAAAKFEQARALYHRERDRVHGLRFGLDTYVWSTATLALVEWFRGNEAVARAHAVDAVNWARDIEHLPSLGIALLYSANLHHYAGERSEVAALAEELIALDKKYGFPAYSAYGAFFKAWAEGDVQLPEAIVLQLKFMGCTAALSYYASLAAETDAEQGRVGSAVKRIENCIELCSSNEERYFEAELRRLLGCYLSQLGAKAEAAAALDAAFSLARQQGALWVEQRLLAGCS
ncbi:MAG TPA: TOMM system kinase/cyclase fusion protein [Polyangiaceae bacterium]|nr:TOMM system kinase/cyclase fusion protein [Polyangiaceae bacterium]